MFSPQRKGFSGWSISPHAVAAAPASVGRKGNSVSVAKRPPPPLASLGDAGAGADAGDMEVWRRFRDAGLLDEAELERKDREALLDRVSRLELELYDYQHNMGLLLIEKNKLLSKYEELRKKLAEADELLEREQAAHLIALSEVEKREENLRQALVVEKHCVSDLEKALQEIRTQSSGMKLTSEKKLADVHALATNTDEKVLEAEAKLRAADAKMAEASRKSLEVERRLQELETRDNVLRGERLSFQAEGDANEKAFTKQREDLLDWEKNLRDSQGKLLEETTLLKKREDMASEKERALNLKEKYLTEERERVEMAISDLKVREINMDTKSSALAIKEKTAILQERNLGVKEEELYALQEKLDAREKMNIQQLVNEHNAFLNSKKHEFELVMDRKRKTMDEEMKRKLTALKQKEGDINLMEQKMMKREQELDSRLEKLKQNEKNYEANVKVLKEQEKIFKAEEVALEIDKKNIEAEKQVMLNRESDLERERSAAEDERRRLLTEQENLKISEDERRKFSSLQLKLREEIESYNRERQFLEQEKENLKQDKDKFEQQWEALDEKQAEIDKELNWLKKEKERLEKWKHDEELKLRSMNEDMQSNIERELEALRLERSSFESTIQHERAEIHEKVQRERDDMLHKFELRSRELEADLQDRQENMEKQLEAKEKEFEEGRERALRDIELLREHAQRQMAEMKLERQQIEREKCDIVASRKDIERDQLEIQNDINELQLLSKNLKNQREALVAEKSRFLTVADEHRSCKNCGQVIFSNLQLLQGLEDTETSLTPRLAERHLSENMVDKSVSSTMPSFDISPSSTGRLSWLRKCTSRIFSISPTKKAQEPANCKNDDEQSMDVSIQSGEVEPFEGTTNSCSDIPKIQSDNSVRERKSEPSASVNAQSVVAKAPFTSGVMSALPEAAEGSGPSKRKYVRRKPASKGRLKATRSVKMVIDDAKVFLGETSELNKDCQENGKAEEPLPTIERSEDSRPANVGLKQQHVQASQTTVSEQDTYDSEARSNSVATGRRRKRRQTVAPGLETPGKKRYNLRRPNVAATVPVTLALRCPTFVAESYHRKAKVDEHGSLGEVAVDLKHKDAPSGVAGEDDNDISVSQKGKVIEEIHEEIRPQKIVLVEKNDLSTASEGIGEGSLKIREVSHEQVNRMIDVDDVNGQEESESLGVGNDCEGSGDGYEHQDEEDDYKDHDVSIGKKLWNFFTT